MIFCKNIKDKTWAKDLGFDHNNNKIIYFLTFINYKIYKEIFVIKSKLFYLNFNINSFYIFIQFKYQNIYKAKWNNFI